MNINLTEFDHKLLKLILDRTKGLTKNCVRNSIHHLEKAWMIKDNDPEMAAFRAITAEEEAATAIFIALKEKGYDNATKIKFKKHTYKLGLYPFIQSVGKFVSDSTKLPNFPLGDNFLLSIEHDGKEINLLLSFIVPGGKRAYPIPPLNFSISMEGEPYSFEKELKDITSGENKKEIQKYIENIANIRNNLLYASPNGIPFITSGIDGEISQRQKRVVAFLRILALIFPYQEKSLFVQQALNSYLNMLGIIERAIEEKDA